MTVQDVLFFLSDTRASCINVFLPKQFIFWHLFYSVFTSTLSLVKLLLLGSCSPIHSVWFLVSRLYNMCPSIMHKLFFYCDSCGSRFLQNIGPNLPEYKASHPRRLLLSPYIATVGICLTILQTVISKKTITLLPLPLHLEISAFIIIGCMGTSHWKHWALIFTTDYKYNTTILTCKI